MLGSQYTLVVKLYLIEFLLPIMIEWQETIDPFGLDNKTGKICKMAVFGYWATDMTQQTMWTL